jgi:MerR family transcriptional regulator, heat shock protein HspR
MAGGMDDAARGVFAISVAAELTGLHPQTLRIYEREGLVSPSRSDGGTRRYSRDDIDRLNEIATLMASGMNLVGVRRVLELEKENRRLQAQIDAVPAEAPGTRPVRSARREPRRG